jgi:hypothetical protein
LSAPYRCSHRLDPFSPRHVRHFAESDLLDLVGKLLPFRLIGRAHPVGDELLELRDIIRTNGRAATLEEAKAQFQANYRKWLVWAKLEVES